MVWAPNVPDGDDKDINAELKQDAKPASGVYKSRKLNTLEDF